MEDRGGMRLKLRRQEHANSHTTNSKDRHTSRHTRIHKTSSTIKTKPSLLSPVFLRRVVDRAHARLVANDARRDLCVDAPIQRNVGGFAVDFLGLEGNVDLFGG